MDTAGVSTASTSFLRFAGFRFVGSDATSYHPAIQIVPSGSHDIQFVNNDVSGEGVQLQTASRVLLQGNYIHNVTRNCALTAPDGGGLFLTGGSASNPPADDIQVIGNTIQSTPRGAIDLVHNLTNVVVDHNDVSTTQNPAVRRSHRPGADRGRRQGTVHDHQQRLPRRRAVHPAQRHRPDDREQPHPARPGNGCSWWPTRARGSSTTPGGTATTAPTARTAAPPAACSCRDYAPGSSWTKAPFSYTNHMTGTTIENNIMRVMSQRLAVNPVAGSAYHEDYNLIFGPRQNNSGLQGTHTLFAMPAFQNPTTNNYQLTPTSPGTGAARAPPSHPPTTGSTPTKTATTTPNRGILAGLVTAPAPSPTRH